MRACILNLKLQHCDGFSSLNIADCVWNLENCHFSTPLISMTIQLQSSSKHNSTLGISCHLRHSRWFPCLQESSLKRTACPYWSNKGLDYSSEVTQIQKPSLLLESLNVWKISFVVMEITDFHVFSMGDMKAVIPLGFRGSWDHFQINC